MKYLINLFAVFLFTLLTVLNCAAGDSKNEYKTDPATGLKYLFFKHNKNGVKPAMGDIAFVRIVYKRDDDSLLFDSHAGGRTDSTSMIPLSLQASFKGSIEQGIAMMAVGDSASFLINADSIYLKAFKFKSTPYFVKKGSNLKFYIKLVRFETVKQMKDQQYAMVEKRREDDKKMQGAESVSIEKYLKDNNITVKPVMIDSLYILQRTGTIGKPIYEGDSVEVRYKVSFLDGKVFEQSDKGDGSKGTYTILYKRNAQLIKGWIELLSTMHEGEKVRTLLPSSMAYGSAGAGNAIQPYTPLIFDIDVVKVTSPQNK